MTNKICVWLLVTVLLQTFSVAEAQQATKVKVVGLLGTWPAHWIDQLKQGLRELGWVEGQNIEIHYWNHNLRSDLRRDYAAKLVKLKVDVIVTAATAAAIDAKRATKTIPIVMAGASDPIGWGLVDSLARPGANLTGFRNLANELGAKRLELLKEIFPKLSRVAALWLPASKGNQPQIKEIEVAARALQIQLVRIGIEGANDFENAFFRMKRERAEAMMTMSGPWVASQAGRIVELAAIHHLPAIYPDRSFVEAGGLMSYGRDRDEQLFKVATYVDKILNGVKPHDLPVEQPAKFEFVINIKTAKQIGVTIPPQVLMDADRVIR